MAAKWETVYGAIGRHGREKTDPWSSDMAQEVLNVQGEQQNRKQTTGPQESMARGKQILSEVIWQVLSVQGEEIWHSKMGNSSRGNRKSRQGENRSSEQYYDTATIRHSRSLHADGRQALCSPAGHSARRRVHCAR